MVSGYEQVRMLSYTSVEVGVAMHSTKWDVSYQVLDVDAIDTGKLRVRWSDGSVREYDPSPLMDAGGDYFGRLRDPAYFKCVRVSEFGDTVEWPEGQDIAPEDLYEQAYVVTD